MTERCPADCLSMFPSKHSLAMHLFKSEDDAHDEWETYDGALEDVYTTDTSLNATASADADGSDPSPSDGVTDGPAPSAAVEHETVDDHDASEVRADGGTGLGLDGKPERPADAIDDGETDGDGDDDPTDTVDCPGCGDDTGATPDELEHGHEYVCTECGHEFPWTEGDR